MARRIVVDQDSVEPPYVLPGLPETEVLVAMGITLTGTGHATIGDKQVCLVKDVQKKRYDFTYQTPVFSVFGNGTIRIEPVAADHVLSASEVMVSGGKVNLVFDVAEESVAKSPHGEPDPTPPLGPYEFTLTMSNDFVAAPEE